VLQVDGYAGCKVLAERGNVQLAFCWRHVRQHFTNSPRPAHTKHQFELATTTLHAVNRHLETGSLSSKRLTDSFRV
jgi:transposase